MPALDPLSSLSDISRLAGAAAPRATCRRTGYRLRRITLLVLVIAVIVAVGCGNDDSSSAPCARDARAFDDLDREGDIACLGDTVMLRLDPEGSGMAGTIRIMVPEAGRFRFCLDLGDEHPHRLALHDGGGALLAGISQGAGCIEVDLPAGLHEIRARNGRAAHVAAEGYLAFFRPDRESVAIRDEKVGLDASTLLGSYTLSTYCPGCDLRGVDLSGAAMVCFDKTTGSCQPFNPGNARCSVVNTKWVYSYNLENDLSGARFGGANLLGAYFYCVNFTDAEFWDDTFGPVRLGIGPSCCTEGFPPRPTTFETSQMSGASFRNVDLRTTDLSCSIPDSTGGSVYDPSLLPGVDLRGANLAGVDYSTKRCPTENSSDPPQRLDLSGALLDASTNLQNADLGSANLSGWDWHATDWSTMTMQHAILSGGNMSHLDLTASPYAGKFFIADKQSDRFADVDFSGVDLTGAKLAGLNLDGAYMPSTNFSGANLHGVSVAGADFYRADFTGADLGSIVATEAAPASFNGATMIRTFLKSASLPGSFFRGAVLAPANLAAANLSGAYFEVAPSCLDPQGNCLASQVGCVCQSATLSGSYMHNTILAGAHMSDTVLDLVSWYNDNPVLPVATGAGAFLNGASFNLADLPGLDLTGAYLQGVTMTNTQLVGANLTGAMLGRDGTVRANLSVSNLRGANLTDADLSYANLQNAGVSAAPEQEVFIEVLKDPDHYQAAQVYQYFAVDRPATNLGASGGASVATEFATCPNGTQGPCGDISSPAWVAPVGPLEPTDCTPSEFDGEGNVIGITCSSSRHPTGG